MTEAPSPSTHAGEAVCPDRGVVRSFLLGKLHGPDADAVDAHLQRCPNCQARLAAADADDDLVRDVRRGSRELYTHVVAAAERLAQQALTLPGDSPLETGVDWLAPPDRAGDLGRIGPYRVVSIVGQGGMGVVFRAEDTRLPRAVALKVLLDQRCLSPEYRKRFAGEAATLARLQHPNVVQVFETGEHHGRPYLALEFVAGGSLAGRLGGAALRPADAATSVGSLARAMQVAHDLGIVHRDLKPGNVLVASGQWPVASEIQNEGSSLATSHWPLATSLKITDFGLARDSSGESLTETGAALGTPGYMAPELIAAQHNSSPLVDAYSLGAILFELLTGRPPFRGDTPYDTLRKSQIEEPEWPRRLNPGVPRDLETICLKCLEKESGRRYRSAAALADDLERYLRGEPIVARAVGPVERVWKWSRRRPALAALVAVSTLAAVTLAVGGAIYQWKLRAALADAQSNAQRADANYRAARVALYETIDAGRKAADGGVPQVRELHHKQALAALEFFRAAAEQAAATDLDARRELAWALAGLGEAATNLGKREEAVKHCREAVAMLDELLAKELDRRQWRYDRAYARGLAGFNLVWAGKAEESLTDLNAAVAELQELHAVDPTNREFALRLAKHSHDLGTAHRRLNHFDDAATHFQRAVDVHTGRLTNMDRKAADETMLADSHIGLGLVHWQKKDFARAVGAYCQAEERLLAARRLQPHNPDAAAAMGAMYINWGLVHQDENKLDDALSRFTRAIEVLKEAHDREPKFARLWLPLRNAYGANSTVLKKLSRFDEAARSSEAGAAFESAKPHEWRADAIECWVKHGDFPEAVAAAKRAKFIDPANWPKLRESLQKEAVFAPLREREDFRAVTGPDS